MRITDTAVRPCTAGRWHSVDDYQNEDDMTRSIFHYSTLMLKFNIDHNCNWDGNVYNVTVNLGHGSVSDQGGLNEIFRKLGMPFRYRRDARNGGPRIEMSR